MHYTRKARKSRKHTEKLHAALAAVVRVAEAQKEFEENFELPETLISKAHVGLGKGATAPEDVLKAMVLDVRSFSKHLPSQEEMKTG